MKRGAETHRTLADVAGDWSLRREAGLGAAEQADFEAWLAADPAHGCALAEFERTWRELRQPRERGFAALASNTLALRQARRVRRARVRSCCIGALAAAAILVFAFIGFGERSASALPESVALRPDRQILPDGSVVELNAGAQIETAFTPERRGVRLLRGEALFLVHKDPARPFVVTAGAIAVRAVGTAFSVRHESAQVEVLVTEGKVSVERTIAANSVHDAAPAALSPTFVSAGGHLRVPLAHAAATLPPVAQASPGQVTQALAWRNKRIELSDTPLADVLPVLNRENALQLAVADAETGALEISGIFWADDAETFVRLIETGLQLEAVRSGNQVTLRRK